MKETNLKSGRLRAKLQETREPCTVMEFYVGRETFGSYAQPHGGEATVTHRGCGVLRSWMESQAQNRGFQLTLPFSLGTTPLRDTIERV